MNRRIFQPANKKWKLFLVHFTKFTDAAAADHNYNKNPSSRGICFILTPPKRVFPKRGFLRGFLMFSDGDDLFGSRHVEIRRIYIFTVSSPLKTRLSSMESSMDFWRNSISGIKCGFSLILRIHRTSI